MPVMHDWFCMMLCIIVFNVFSACCILSAWDVLLGAVEGPRCLAKPSRALLGSAVCSLLMLDAIQALRSHLPQAPPLHQPSTLIGHVLIHPTNHSCCFFLMPAAYSYIWTWFDLSNKQPLYQILFTKITWLGFEYSIKCPNLEFHSKSL